MNFEALGRYTDGVQKINQLIDDRQAVIDQLTSLLTRSTSSSVKSHRVYPAGTDAARSLLGRLQTIEDAMQRAVEEANAAAEHCQRQPMIWGE